MNQAQQTVQMALTGQLPIRFRKPPIDGGASPEQASVPKSAPPAGVMIAVVKIFCHRIKKGRRAAKVTTKTALKKYRSHLKVCQDCNRCVAPPVATS